jgi:hypothetical protein
MFKGEEKALERNHMMFNRDALETSTPRAPKECDEVLEGFHA